MQNLCLTSAHLYTLSRWRVQQPPPMLTESQLDPGVVYLADWASGRVAQLRLSTSQCQEVPIEGLGGGGGGLPADSAGFVSLTCVLESDEWVCLCAQRSICQVTFDPEFVDEPKVAIVGEFDDPILAVAWSPGCELVAFVKSDNKMVLMDNRFEPVWEADLMQEGFGKEAFIDVGWGKKETQFHGSAGKAAAMKPNEPCLQAFAWDMGRVSVSWRGDAEALCTSCISGLTGVRQVRVWSPHDGSLLSTSDVACGGLEWALDWRPSGSLIAAARRLAASSGRLQVQLLERNGLCHGEFGVRAETDTTHIERLRWNSSSEILLVELVDRANPSGDKIVQLWSSCNYHWYLRWCQAYPRDTVVEWSSSHWCCLSVLNPENGLFTRLRFHWEVSRCRTQLPACNTLVPVIDGCRLQVTPLRVALVPPPMSVFWVDFDVTQQQSQQKPGGQHKRQVLWARPLPDRPNWLALVLACGQVCLLCPAGGNEDVEGLTDCPDASVHMDQCGGFGFAKTAQDYRCLSAGVTLSEPHASHVEPLSGLRLLQYSAVNRCISIFRMLSPGSSDPILTVSMAEVIGSHEAVVTLNSAPSGTKVYCQTDAGRIMAVDIGAETPDASPQLPPSSRVSALSPTLPESCPQAEVVEFGPNPSPSGATSQALVCLSESFNLYCVPLFCDCDVNSGQVLRAAGVTSFCLHSSFILVTSISHRLISVRLNVPAGASEAFHALNDDLAAAAQAQQRQLQSTEETSATSATAAKLNNDPRGSYSDRVRRVERGARLVACAAGDSLTVMQMPRGNLEGVHPRSLVLEKVSALLDSAEYGPAFELMRRNRINLNLLVDHNPKAFMLSIDRFIDSVRNDEYINVFIAELDNMSVTSGMYSRAYSSRTCSTQQEPHLADEPDDEHQAGAAGDFTAASADAAAGVLDAGFRHLLYLSDVHSLYNCALGTYDLDLALLVAQRTHKDPKDYVG